MKYLAFQSLIVLSLSCNGQADEINLTTNPAYLKASLGLLDKKTGVRADVLLYVHESSAPGSDQEKALLQLGRDYNRALTHLGDETLSLKNAKRILQSEFCIRAVFPEYANNFTSKIHSLTLDNYQRARLGIRLNSYLGRSLPYLPKEQDWIKECHFTTKVISQ
jgi:hypothetical protein